MKFFSALFIGIISGFTVYMILAMLMEEREISRLFVMTTFLGALAITFYIVIEGVQTTTEVWARGSLVWAVEWILASIVPIYVSRLALIESSAYTGETLQKENAQIEAWEAASMGIGFCLFMAVTSYSLYLMVSRRRR